MTGRQNTRHLSACATFYYMLDAQPFLQPHFIFRSKRNEVSLTPRVWHIYTERERERESIIHYYQMIT